MSGVGKTVCVTGASGYIASWLVKLLLQRGYTVNATVRCLDEPNKVRHLAELEGAKERLHLFEADLTKEGSFDPAIEGCDGVFHTASPCFQNAEDPQKWYGLSKVLAEQEAWEYAKEKGIDLVSICPGMVLGPSLQPVVKSSCALVLDLIGAESYPSGGYGWIHVKDVANAHIQAFEMHSASGRYCLVERDLNFSDIVKILRQLYPSLQLPSKCVEAKPYMPQCKFSRERAESLGIDFIPIEACLKEMVEDFRDKQLICS